MESVRTLINGRSVKNAPEDMSNAELHKWAYSKGYISANDLDKSAFGLSDLITPAGEIAGGMAGAAYGAAYGAAIGSVLPVAGTAIGAGVGAIAGGALGTFGGSLAGQTAESVVEGTTMDAGETLSKAGEAGIQDALWSAGGMAIFKAIKSVAKPLVSLFQPQTVNRIAGEATQKVTSGELDTLQRLQGNLAESGTSLLPSQTGIASSAERFGEEYLTSTKLNDIVDLTLKQQDDYITKQIQGIVRNSAGVPRKEFGEAFQRMLGDTEKAIKDVARPMYDEIDRLGNTLINTAPLKDAADAYAKQITAGMGSTGTARVKNILLGVADEMTPAQATRTLKDLRTVKVAGGAEKAMLNSFITKLEKATQADNLVKTAAIKDLGTKTLGKVTKASGASGVTGAEKSVAERLAQMRPNMSFKEAHVELSDLKALQRDLSVSDVPKGNSLATLQRSISLLENSMDSAAKVFDPNLKAKYDAAKTFYNTGINTVYADYMKKALRAGSPEDVGDLIHRAGNVTSVDQVRDVLKLAKQLDVRTGVKQGVSIESALRKGYIKSVFKGNDLGAVKNFEASLLNPKFRETFETMLEGTKEKKKILQLIDEAQVLSKNLVAQEGSTLAVRSREYSAALDPAKMSTAIYAVLPSFFEKGLKPETINRQLMALKGVNAALKQGKPVPESLAVRFVDAFPSLGAKLARTTGATERTLVDN